MNIEDIREYCMALPGTSESFPFDETTLVFKVMGKMYLLAALDRVPPYINVKGDPQRSEHLRAEWPAVTPGYHMDKRHWNSVALDGSLPPGLVRELVDASYALVVAGLPRSKRALLENRP